MSTQEAIVLQIKRLYSNNTEDYRQHLSPVVRQCLIKAAVMLVTQALRCARASLIRDAHSRALILLSVPPPACKSACSTLQKYPYLESYLIKGHLCFDFSI